MAGDTPVPLRPPAVMVALIALVALAILLAIFLPPCSGDCSKNAARKSQAKNDLTQLCAGIKAFHTDYSYYPCDKNTGNDSKDFFASGGKSETLLIAILKDDETKSPIVTKYNSNHVVYLDVPFAKDPNIPKSGIGPDACWYDPFGHPYLIRIDSNDNGRIEDPYSKPGSIEYLKEIVIAWSLGTDGKGPTLPTGNNAIFQGSDDIASWQ